VLDKGPILKPPMLPIVSLSYGLNRKATAWSLQSWIALSLTLDGRDKITKLVQYGARFMAWWLTSSDSANSQRFMELYQSVAKSRKAFRLGRSVIEIDKLQSMGLVSVALWHLRVALNDGDPRAVPKSRPRLTRKASSNIGWGPSTVPSSSSRDRSFYRSLSNIGYRMYRPMVSQLSLYGPSSQPTKAPAWKIIGSALKIVGLLGFWAADNVSFLTASGFLDNYKLKTSKRLERRQSIQTRAARFAAQSYFMGAVAGLFVNLRSYWSHRQNEIKSTQDIIAESEDEDNRQAAKGAQEKQFELFLALLKSCCDVLAFSNMPGVDLHQKYRGKKMNEGFHCLCGLVSASTVLYSNFPNAG
jgi:Peroxisomal biogenesis factor 11 (PEX11)